MYAKYMRQQFTFLAIYNLVVHNIYIIKTDKKQTVQCSTIQYSTVRMITKGLFILFKEDRWGCSWPQAIPPISTPPILSYRYAYSSRLG